MIYGVRIFLGEARQKEKQENKKYFILIDKTHLIVILELNMIQALVKIFIIYKILKKSI